MRCRQTNHEGEYVDWCHDALDWADGVIVESRRVDALLATRFATRSSCSTSRSSRCISRTSTSGRSGGGTSVLADWSRRASSGKGPEGYREALEFIVGADERPHRRGFARCSRSRCSSRTRRTCSTSRASRARTRRCSSSRSACGSSPTFATPRPRARVEGVEFEETKRALLRDLAERLGGPIGFEADVRLVHAATRRCAAAASSPCRARASSSGCARSRTRTSSRRSGARARSRTACSSGSPTSGSSAARERDVAWRIEQLFHERGRRQASRSRRSSPPGRTPRGRTRVPSDREIGTRRDGGRRHGLHRRRLRVGLHAHVRDRARSTASIKEAYDVVPGRAAGRPRGDPAGRRGRRRRRGRAARDRRDGFAGTFGHGLGHGLGLEVHEAPRLSTESTDTLAPGNVVTVEPGIYLEGRGGIRIEDNVVVTRRRDREPHERSARS